MVNGIFGSLVLKTPNDTIDRLFRLCEAAGDGKHLRYQGGLDA
jgi:hypothetical protein